MKQANIFTVNDLNNEEVMAIFQVARSLQTHLAVARKGNAEWKDAPYYHTLVMGTLFFEPSTRTRLSFETAMVRLGGRTVSAAEPNSLSLAKGETISDTLLNASRMVDILVVRSDLPHAGWFELDMDYFRVPVINAGDGPWNHPSQALLDLYTIWDHHSCAHTTRNLFPEKPLVHCIVGDLGRSRAIRSYVQLMSRQEESTFYLFNSATEGVNGEYIPDIKTEKAHIYYCELKSFEDIVPEADVFYLNRVQKERRGSGLYPQYEISNPFRLKESHLNTMKQSAIVLNPGPRREELPVRLTHWNAVKMLKQVENGVFVRMGLIRHCIQKSLGYPLSPVSM